MDSALQGRLDPVLAIAAENAAQVDADGVFPEAAVAALRTSGLMGLVLPVEDGGLGASPADFSEVASQLASACGSTAMVYLMHISAAVSINAAPPGGDRSHVRAMADGSNLGTLAFSEKGSRSHFWAPVSQAVDQGSTVQLKAEKSWVTSANEAQVILASCQAPAGEEGLQIYSVRSGTPGMTVAGPWRGMGLRGNDSAPVNLDVQLTRQDLLAAEGFGIMMGTVLPWFSLGNASVSLGLATGALNASIRHASGARFAQNDQSLADLPTIRARLAKMSVTVSTTQAYVRHVADQIATGDEGAMLGVLQVKAAANEAALLVTDEAMRVCGGVAFSAHLGVDRYFRDARAGHVMAPTVDVLYDFIGKAITGQELF